MHDAVCWRARDHADILNRNVIRKLCVNDSQYYVSPLRLVAMPADCEYLQPVLGAQIREGKVAFTHLARVKIRGLNARAYVKEYDRRSPAKTLSEVLGYTLASHTNLPQPAMAALVSVPGRVLSQLSTGRPGIDGRAFEFDDQHVCFATIEVVGHEGGRVRSFAAAKGWCDDPQIDPSDLERTLFEWAAKWPHFGRLQAFDAWIANPDRNLGNVLWVSDKHFVVIDHGEMFDGLRRVDGINLAWPAIFDDPAAVHPHKLLDAMIRLRPEFPSATAAAVSQGCDALNDAYIRSRDELNFWLAGASNSVRLRAHHWLWKRLDDRNLHRAVNQMMGRLV